MTWPITRIIVLLHRNDRPGETMYTEEELEDLDTRISKGALWLVAFAMLYLLIHVVVWAL